MKKILKYTAIILLCMIAVIISGYEFTKYRPDQIEYVYVNKDNICDTLKTDTLSILSWNIGYAGYSDSMDFFYEGGKQVRETKEKAHQNLCNIIKTLKSFSSVDFILLQEVDICSKRSYHMNFIDSIQKEFPEFRTYYASNFRFVFLPVPITHPMGDVESGLLIMTRQKPDSVIRHQLPGNPSLTNSIFKRAILEAQFTLKNKQSISIINLHNSAFDDGNIRKEEIGYIDSVINKRSYAIAAGDWNCNPPGYNPSEAELTNKYFSPVALTGDELHSVNFLTDLDKPSMRYLYEPYRRGHTLESLIDFAVATKQAIEPIQTQIVDLGFKFSDHNPVYYKIKLAE